VVGEVGSKPLVGRGVKRRAVARLLNGGTEGRRDGGTEGRRDGGTDGRTYVRTYVRRETEGREGEGKGMRALAVTCTRLSLAS
jgi:hypothetical protein